MAARNKRRVDSSSASSGSELSSPGSSLSSLSPPPEDIDLQDWPPQHANRSQDDDEDILTLEGLPPLPREEEDEYMPTLKSRRQRLRSTASPAGGNSTKKPASTTKSRTRTAGAIGKRKAAALSNNATLTSKKKKSSRKPRQVKEITPEPVIEPDPDTLEYDPDTAVIVMFQARFEPLFEDLTDLGPQDLEEGVSSEEPSPQVEALLCRLLSLALNRKKPVEPPHYQRACEEAMTYRGTLGCPEDWLVSSPFGSGRTFRAMDWRERLLVLKYLVYWSLQQSNLVRQFVGTANSRKDQDTIVTPLGYDSQNRAYYLIEGNNDTRWKLYREAPSPYAPVVSWAPVATDVDQLKQLLHNGFELPDPNKEVKQEEQQQQEQEEVPLPPINENTKEGQLRIMIQKLLPRLENGELRRHRRDIRLQRKAAFEARALDGGVGIYTGRTRGVRINYANMSSDDGGAAASGAGGGGYESSDNNSSSGSGARVVGTRRSARMMALHHDTPPGARRSGRLARMYTPQEGDEEEVEEEEEEEEEDHSEKDYDEENNPPESLTVVLKYHGKVEDQDGVKHEDESTPMHASDTITIAAAAAAAAAPKTVMSEPEKPILPSSTVADADAPGLNVVPEKEHVSPPVSEGVVSIPQETVSTSAAAPETVMSESEKPISPSASVANVVPEKDHVSPPPVSEGVMNIPQETVYTTAPAMQIYNNIAAVPLTSAIVDDPSKQTTSSNNNNNDNNDRSPPLEN